MESEFHLQLQKSPPFICNIGQKNSIRTQNSNIHLNISLPYMHRIPKGSLPQIKKYLLFLFQEITRRIKIWWRKAECFVALKRDLLSFPTLFCKNDRGI